MLGVKNHNTAITWPFHDLNHLIHAFYDKAVDSVKPVLTSLFDIFKKKMDYSFKKEVEEGSSKHLQQVDH